MRSIRNDLGSVKDARVADWVARGRAARPQMTSAQWARAQQESSQRQCISPVQSGSTKKTPQASPFAHSTLFQTWQMAQLGERQYSTSGSALQRADTALISEGNSAWLRNMVIEQGMEIVDFMHELLDNEDLSIRRVQECHAVLAVMREVRREIVAAARGSSSGNSPIQQAAPSSSKASGSASISDSAEQQGWSCSSCAGSSYGVCCFGSHCSSSKASSTVAASAEAMLYSGSTPMPAYQYRHMLMCGYRAHYNSGLPVFVRGW